MHLAFLDSYWDRLSIFIDKLKAIKADIEEIAPTLRDIDE